MLIRYSTYHGITDYRRHPLILHSRTRAVLYGTAPEGRRPLRPSRHLRGAFDHGDRHSAVSDRVGV